MTLKYKNWHFPFKKFFTQGFYWICKKPSHPISIKIKEGPFTKIIAVLLIFLSLSWNIRNFYPNLLRLPKFYFSVMYSLGLDQRWQMFVWPFRKSGWFVIPAKLADGRDVDLFRNGQSLNWQKPSAVRADFRGERDRKYMYNLFNDDADTTLLLYGRYLCRQWNREHTQAGSKLEAFKLVYRNQLTLLDGSKGSVESQILWQHECESGLLYKWKTSLMTAPLSEAQMSE